MAIDVSVRLSAQTIDVLDRAAAQLQRSLADLIRFAVETFLEDFDDVDIALNRLRDPSDPTLDWNMVRRFLLDSDE